LTPFENKVNGEDAKHVRIKQIGNGYYLDRKINYYSSQFGMKNTFGSVNLNNFNSNGGLKIKNYSLKSFSGF
jgi:hypothetical protein